MSIKLHDSGPSLKFDIKCMFMWSHLWAGVVRVGHRRTFCDQSTSSALLLVLTCNHEDHGVDHHGDCEDHGGDRDDQCGGDGDHDNGHLVPRHL